MPYMLHKCHFCCDLHPLKLTPAKKPSQKRKESSSSHPFSGANLLLREGNFPILPTDFNSPWLTALQKNGSPKAVVSEPVVLLHYSGDFADFTGILRPGKSSNPIQIPPRLDPNNPGIHGIYNPFK